MATETICSITSISDFLVCPTLHNYYFWLIIFIGLIFILSWRIHVFQKKDDGKGDLISALGTSTIAFSVLGVLGTLIKNADDIPMIQSDVLLILFAITIPCILIWIFRKT